MRRGKIVVAGALVALLFAVASSAALAKTYRPNKRGDHAPNGCTKHDCTLREAVIKANHHPGPDVIVLRSGRTYRRSATPGTNEDFAQDGDLDVRSPLTIRSSGRRLATVDARHNERVFEVPYTSGTTASRLALKRLKVVNGLAGAVYPGGAVVTADLGRLTVSRSVLANNSAESGGAIAGASLITKTTLRGNSAMANGGAIYDHGLSVVLKNSTLNGNFASVDGGAIYADGTHPKLVNDTLAANRANNDGGGITATSGAVVHVNAVTIARNRGDADGNKLGTSGGIYSEMAASFAIKNSLVALNSAHGVGDCVATIQSGGHNIFSSTTPAVCVTLAPSDRTSLSPSEIGLGPLRDNGGPTKTDKLLKGSEAINHAGGDAPKRDQRGVKRYNPDIGAFERR